MQTHSCAQLHQPARQRCCTESPFSRHKHLRHIINLGTGHAQMLPPPQRPCPAFQKPVPNSPRMIRLAPPAVSGLNNAVTATVQIWAEIPILGQSCIRILGLTLLALYAADITIKWVNIAAEKAKAGAYSAAAQNTASGRSDPVAAGRAVALTVLEGALCAAHKPLTVLLPAAATLYAFKEVLSIVDLFVEAMPGTYSFGAEFLLKQTDRLLDAIVYVAGSASELIIVITMFWFLNDWKNNIVEMLIALEHTDEKFARMIRPLNTLSTWMLSVTAFVNVLHVVGYNVQPLLAAGGVSGIALGFGAQKITQNLLAGITLFLTQPFVVGERVTLLNGGSKVVTGFVESINPLSTIIRDDDGVPITIPNVNVQGYHVANESRKYKKAEEPAPAFLDPPLPIY